MMIRNTQRLSIVSRCLISSHRCCMNNNKIISIHQSPSSMFRAPTARRWLSSTNATAIQQTKGGGGGGGRTRWQQIASIARMIRIPVLVTSVYGFGYQQGVMDCTKAPQSMQEKILANVLLSTGVTDPSTQIEVVSERDVSMFVRKPSQQVAAVGSKIIHAAQDLVEEELRRRRRGE